MKCITEGRWALDAITARKSSLKINTARRPTGMECGGRAHVSGADRISIVEGGMRVENVVKRFSQTH